MSGCWDFPILAPAPDGTLGRWIAAEKIEGRSMGVLSKGWIDGPKTDPVEWHKCFY